MKLYDCVIVGAGPAGLSAAIYLARFNRSVAVIDNHNGRSSYPQMNDNYLGFPSGIHARELRELGKKQAERFNAEFLSDTVTEITSQKKIFKITGEKTALTAKTVILATGVTDILPIFENYQKYFGNSMFWCLECDGYKTIDKKVMIVGNEDEAATTCLQFLNYTQKLVFVTNSLPDQVGISQSKINLFKKYDIPFHAATIIDVQGEGTQINSVYLNDGKKIEVDLVFTEQGSNPNISLALQLGVKLDKKGFILTDKHLHTNIPGVYAAGDVTKVNAHQVSAAVYEGAIAAEAVNYDLYDKDQQED